MAWHSLDSFSQQISPFVRQFFPNLEPYVSPPAILLSLAGGLVLILISVGYGPLAFFTASRHKKKPESSPLPEKHSFVSLIARLDRRNYTYENDHDCNLPMATIPCPPPVNASTMTASESRNMMKDVWGKNTTNVQVSAPDDVTGIERIMLAARGDLQRLLSAFFATPLTINLIYARTGDRRAAASPTNPIRQTRQVHLVCDSVVVCIATSVVTITSPLCETLFFDEKFAIGQLFRELGQTPVFSLLKVEVGKMREDGSRGLERTYTLEADGVICEILEEFADRDMFSLGNIWLDQQKAKNSRRELDTRPYSPDTDPDDEEIVTTPPTPTLLYSPHSSASSTSIQLDHHETSSTTPLISKA